MNSNEEALRLFYLDHLFTKSTKNVEPISLEFLSSTFNELSERVFSMSFEDILKQIRLSETLTFWSCAYLNKNCTQIELPIEKACADDRHIAIDSHLVSQGTLLSSLLEKAYLLSELRERIDFPKKFSPFFLDEAFPIVRKYGELYEVLMGNHRVMAAIELGLEKIKAICLEE